MMTGTLLHERYRLGAELGRGGMGVVFEATDERLGRRVALKLVTSETLDPNARARFVREARAAARLDHPHVVRLFDFGEMESAAFLVMELVPGPTLRTVGPLEMNETISVARQLALALAHAHSRGVVHRDLKPENVAVAERTPLTVKLMDFGLASVQGATQLTRPGAVVGTFAYVAPEQALGRPVDRRTDLYALGMLLYELTTGRTAFTGGSPEAILAQHLKAQPVPPRRLNRAVPVALDELILRLLAKDPVERPASAEAVLAALDAVDAEVAPAGVLGPRPALPPELSHPLDLIGRDGELAAIAAMLTGEQAARLVTLTGPGGIGKTRLAIQAALDAAAHVRRIAYVALAFVERASLVETEIARALGVRPDPGQALGGAIREALAGERTLLVLDNLEHLLEAVPIVADLLAACPRLTVLATSRSRLRLAEEHEFAVPPLALTRADAAHAGDDPAPAVALFVARAREARPDFALTDSNAAAIAELCERLDGLPLAIELAAGRMRLLPPGALRDQLKAGGGPALQLLRSDAPDRPGRQRTLEATIAWSVGLLSDDERAMFRRFAGFSGAATLAAIAAVCGDPGATAPDLDLLGSLVDKSLLRRVDAGDDEARFAMLETIREYARAELEASGEQPAVERRHAEHYAAVAEAAEPHLRQRNNPAGVERLERELDNLRAALDWCARNGEAGTLARLAIPLRWFWVLRGYQAEGRRWLLELIAAGDRVPASTLTKAYSGAAVMSHHLGEHNAALELYERLLELQRQIGDQVGVTQTLSNIGIVLLDRGEYERARELCAESLSLRRESGDPSSVGTGLINLSAAALQAMDYAAVEAYAGEALALKRQAGDEWAGAAALDNLGLAALYQGRIEQAEARLAESVSIWRQHDDLRGIGRALVYLGRTRLAAGELAAAGADLRESVAALARVGERTLLTDAFEALAQVAMAAGDALRAAQLLGASEGIRERCGTAASAPDRPALERLEAQLAADAAAGDLRRARAEGRALPMPAAIALALAHSP